MSREILRFGRTGFITKADGTCWQVRVSSDGQRIMGHSRVQDGFPFYSPNCKRAPVYMTAIGNDSWPTSRSGWDVLYASAETDENGRHLFYILLDRFYGGHYWRATLSGEQYSATDLGSVPPADVIPLIGWVQGTKPFKDPRPLQTEPSTRTTDLARLALIGLAVMATVALIYFGGRTVLKRL